MGPGKSTYTLPVTFRFLLSAARVEPAGRGEESRKRKVVDVRRKTYMLVYPDPQSWTITIKTFYSRNLETQNSHI
jgi:hypothetical protein